MQKKKRKVQIKGLGHLSAVALPSSTSLLACSWLQFKGQWKLIKRSHFLLPTPYSLWQLSLCELSIILAVSSIPVEAKPAIIRLLCCRGQATHWMGYIHWRSPGQRGYLLSCMRGLPIILSPYPSVCGKGKPGCVLVHVCNLWCDTEAALPVSACLHFWCVYIRKTAFPHLYLAKSR